jgi:hypothetical protein
MPTVGVKVDRGVQWVGQDPVTHNWLLKIRVGKVAHVYEVEEHPGHYDLYRLDENFNLIRRRIMTTVDGGKVWTCDCPDAKWRPERRHSCKHVLALRKALVNLPF